jgi:hypothetical protein
MSVSRSFCHLQISYARKYRRSAAAFRRIDASAKIEASLRQSLSAIENRVSTYTGRRRGAPNSASAWPSRRDTCQGQLNPAACQVTEPRLSGAAQAIVEWVNMDKTEIGCLWQIY